jgi:ParB/RepB/Spo0J family partition protein
MARQHEAILSQPKYFQVDPRLITVDPTWNYREDFSHVEDLKKSIIENGVLMPIRLRKNGDGELVVIDGECRLRATLKAIEEGHEIFSIPAFISRKGISDTEAYLQSLNSNSGKPPTPFEEAKAFLRLVNWGISVKEIATKIGKSEVHIRNRMKLADATPDTKKAVQNKEITTTEAVNVVKAGQGDTAKQKEALDKAKKKQAKKKEDKAAKKKPPKDRFMDPQKIIDVFLEELEYCKPDKQDPEELQEQYMELQDLMTDFGAMIGIEYDE